MMHQQSVDKDRETDAAVVKPSIAVPDRYDSPFMKLIAPFIATRYLWLAVEEINPFDFLKKRTSLVKEGKIPAVGSGPAWTEPGAPVTKIQKAGRYLSRNFHSMGMGLTFLSAISYYSKTTLDDIHSLYSEAVGYELDKKPQDVTLEDIFSRSENEALKVTRSTFLQRTAMRLATAATFFLPWHKLRHFRELQPEYQANMNVGVGAVGSYLLGELILREKSFFDAEQALTGSSINHNHANPNQSITSMDIKRLILLKRRDYDKSYRWPNASSVEGQQQLAMAERIASLMNQTYDNDPKVEHAHMTIGKFNFLLGLKYLDNFPESLAFVELANRSGDMKDVKQVKAAIENGQDARAVFARHHIDLDKPVSPTPAVPALPVPAMPVPNFAERVQRIRQDKPQSSKTHFEFAAETSALNHSL